MKRKLALFLSIILICTMILPLQSFGAGMNTGLENAIKTAKTLFAIPAEYKFESSISSGDGKNVYNLYWRSKGSDYAYISVRIDDKGFISGYESYNSIDYVQSKKLPKVSRQEAKAKADAFIKKVNPSLVSQIKYEDNYQNNILDVLYYFTYYRIVNGIPFYNDRVSVTISKETGNIQNFSASWTDGLVFPQIGKQITLKQAEDAYKAELGLRLQYKYSYSNEDNKVKTFLVYTPRLDNGNYAVDAFTGKKVKVGSSYYGMFYDSAANYKLESTAAGDSKEIVLSPEEEEAVQNAAKLKTAEDAEKIARAAKFLELTDDFKLENSSMYQNYPLRNEYVWNLSFTKAAADGKTTEQYVSVSVNANSGMIASFYKNTNSDGTGEAKYKLEDTKAEVDAFIKENYPDLYKELAYDADYEEVILGSTGDTLPLSYSYKYNRMVNGVVFPDNGITIAYDAITGKMSSLNVNWFNVEFPSSDKVIGIDTAYTNLFSQIGLELQYKTLEPENVMKIKIAAGVVAEKPDVKLVYALKQGKPLIFDANTGVNIDSQGEPYKAIKPVSYTDIANSSAKKEIMVLAENGVCLDGTEFKPKANITQLDFLTLLSKTLSYYGAAITAKSTQKEIDELYTFLEREGVVKAGEKAPTAVITREDAVKFIIRAMKYDKVADIKGIFKSSLKDINKAQSGLTGYIAIAEGLKIITGTKGYFYPKSKLTREAAAVMIYNYLQV